MEQQFMRCYNRYTDMGNRMSIFSRTVGNNLEIYYLILAPKDKFSKKYALEQYNKFLKVEDEFGKALIIPIMSGDTAAYTLRRWMQQNTWKKVVARSCETWEIPLSCRIRTYVSPLGNHDFVEITKLIRK